MTPRTVRNALRLAAIVCLAVVFADSVGWLTANEGAWLACGLILFVASHLE